jgi:uncharacterized protein
MAVNIPLVLNAILENYQLPWNGAHGVAHWARVLENGRRLTEFTAANSDVVALFAILHDSQRQNEGHDPDHGPRAALYAAEIRGTVLDLPDDQFALLQRACAGHTHERTHHDITVQTCWDADRLDLGRVGILPHPSRLCTSVAKLPETIRWADGRAACDVVPNFVEDEWGIDLRRCTWQSVEDE